MIINTIFLLRVAIVILLFYCAFTGLKMIRNTSSKFKLPIQIILNVTYVVTFLFIFNYDFGNPPTEIPLWLFIFLIFFAVVSFIFHHMSKQDSSKEE